MQTPLRTTPSCSSRLHHQHAHTNAPAPCTVRWLRGGAHAAVVVSDHGTVCWRIAALLRLRRYGGGEEQDGKPMLYNTVKTGQVRRIVFFLPI